MVGEIMDLNLKCLEMVRKDHQEKVLCDYSEKNILGEKVMNIVYI